MLALFDSGTGGLNTVRYLRQTKDDGDLIYLIDRSNAPYGIKSEKEILEITKSNIDALTAMGAHRVLIACCTASTVHHLLPKKYREVSVPIIDAIANEAKRLTRVGRVGVIATRHTILSGAFRKALGTLSVSELEASALVDMIDAGLCDSVAEASDEERIEDMLRPVLTSGIDTLVLGCTHFPALIRTIGRISAKYGDISLVDSARVGADVLRKVKT